MESRLTLFAFALLFAAGCSDDDAGVAPVTGAVTGVASKGPVRAADAEVFAIEDTGAAGDLLGAGTTLDDGSYAIEIADHDGAILVRVHGGTFTDEATGTSVAIPAGRPLTAVAIADDGTATVNATPLSRIATVQAQHLATGAGVGATDAVSNAVRSVELFFGIDGFLTTVPADLAGGPAAPGTAAEMGALSAGVSQLAAELGEPVLDVLDALARDASDGALDGSFLGSPVPPLTGLPVAARLRDAVRAFLESDRNVSGLTSAEIAVDDVLDDRIENGGAPLPMPPRIDALDVTSGPIAGGTVVEITGARLDTGAGVRVLLGGREAHVVTSGEDRVIFQTPPSPAGVVDLVVVNLDTNLTARLEGAFEFFAPAPPRIDAIDPDRGPVSGGTIVEIEGRGFTNDTVVRFGGREAAVIARDLPDRLTVVSPQHEAGAVDVLASNDLGVSEPAVFTYLDRDVDPGLDPSDVLGSWAVFGIDLVEGEPRVFTLTRRRFVFRQDGLVDVTGTRVVPVPAGQPVQEVPIPPETFAFDVQPDGFLILNLTPDEEPPTLLVARLNDEADVFVTEAEGFTVGLRRPPSPSIAQLAGTYFMNGFSERILPGGAIETSSFFGTILFDGAGGGSFGFLRNVEGEGQLVRDDFVGAFRYQVDADGNFFVENDEGLVLEGAFTAAGEIAAGTFVTPDSEVGLMVMARRPESLPSAAAAGTFAGAELRHDGDARFARSSVEMVAGLDGSCLLERRESFADGGAEDGARESVTTGRLRLAPTGALADTAEPPLLRGALSESRRFLLLAPDPASSGRGIGLLLARPAFFSRFSAPGTFHLVLHRDRFGDDARTTGGTGTLHLDPVAAPSVGGSTFGTAGTATLTGFRRRIVSRDGQSLVQTWTEDLPPLGGGFVVGGDGRVFLFLEEDGSVERVGEDNAAFSLMTGMFDARGDLALLRGPRSVAGPVLTGAMGRASIAAPPVSGDFHVGGFSRDFLPAGAATFSDVSGTASIGPGGAAVISGGAFMEFEDGSAPGETPFSASDTLVVNGNGFVQSASGRLSGFATPDGEALFFTDMSSDPAGFSSGMRVLVRRNTAVAPVPAGPSRFHTLAVDPRFDAAGPVSLAGRQAVGFAVTRPGANPIDPFGGAGGFIDTRSGFFERNLAVPGTLARGTRFFPGLGLAVDPTGAAVFGAGATATAGAFSPSGRVFIGAGPVFPTTAVTPARGGFIAGLRR